MSTPKIPYTVQAGMAVAANNDEAVYKIIQSCMQSVVNDVMNGVVYKYDRLDLPIVLVAVKHAVNGLETLLDEEDKTIEEIIMSETRCVTIDASAFRKQAGNEKENNND